MNYIQLNCWNYHFKFTQVSTFTLIMTLETIGV
uniref:Uncharacterized protein n=1 Tax=Tetranychus urticae TaxID=32264 RepID=T1JSU1_TETUR